LCSINQSSISHKNFLERPKYRNYCKVHYYNNSQAKKSTTVITSKQKRLPKVRSDGADRWFMCRAEKNIEKLLEKAPRISEKNAKNHRKSRHSIVLLFAVHIHGCDAKSRQWLKITAYSKNHGNHGDCEFVIFLQPYT